VDAVSLLSPGLPAELSGSTAAAFRAAYGSDPDVVARAPGRVNLIGEHTDYNAGTCLPVALPHATYAAVSPRADDLVRVRSAQAEDEWRGEGIGPGEVTGWASYVAGVAWALREAGLDVPGLDVCVDSTVPLGAGLSSSAALECSVAVAIAQVMGLEDSAAQRRSLAEACMRAETEVAGAPTGGMDQTVALFAEPEAALLIDFLDDTTRAVPLRLGEALGGGGLTVLVIDTRVSHALVDGGYASRRADCEAACRELGVPSLRVTTIDRVEALTDSRTRRRARHVVTEIARVARAVEAIEGSDWPALGQVFVASHESMRDDFEISCPELDAAVEAAVGAGAVGARMTGGGFGGSAVALVPAASVDAVSAAVDRAFDDHGFRRPAFLVADPSPAASLC
jgi:galactokinase